MEFNYNDGGRKLAGFHHKAGGDCVTRAIAIVTGKPYIEVYKELNKRCLPGRLSPINRGAGSSAENGVLRPVWKRYLTELGFTWVPTMFVGQGCKVHLRKEELPSGKILVQVSKHICAVIDGVLNDNHDCTRDGTRCVYGYYYQQSELNG